MNLSIATLLRQLQDSTGLRIPQLAATEAEPSNASLSNSSGNLIENDLS